MVFESGRIPELDPFLYTFQNWNVLHQWLANLTFYVFYWVGGAWGLLVLKITLWSLCFALLIRNGKRWGIQPALTALIVTLTFIACAYRYIDRASLMSDLILAALVTLFLNNDAPKRKWLWFLPLLFAVWVNLHAGFVIGLAFVSVYLIAECIFAKLKTNPIQNFAILTLCYLACLVNPRFVHGALFPLTTAFKPEWALYRAINFEWMPTFRDPFLSTWEVRALILLLIFTAISLAISSWRAPKKSVFAITAFCLYLYLAQDAARFLSTSALGFSVIALYAIRENRFQLKDRVDRFLRWGFATLFAAGAIWIVFNGYEPATGLRKFGVGIDPESFPVEAVKHIKEKNLKGAIFNQYEWGSYLAWTLGPEKRLFIHGHIDDPKLLAGDYYGMSRSKEIFDSTVSRFDIRYFLLNRNILAMNPKPQLVDYLANWKVIYYDDTSVLWARE